MKSNNKQFGSLMLDFDGVELSADERELLCHPDVGGVILFTRNYESIEQVSALIEDARCSCPRPLLVAVDHEGGRVQRFRDGFSRIPPMASIEEVATTPEQALMLAKEFGWLMAVECLATGIDFSFAPVLDRRGISDVIGDRAFSGDADTIISLAGAFVDGMSEAGMKATGKHYPGHGSVKEDSHIAIPVDPRPLPEIEDDLVVFRELIKRNQLAAVMPAHVIYPAVDSKPAGFSSIWIDKLRNELRFTGVIFSDDLAMEGANPMGNFSDRAEAALQAGCDMALLCNNRKAVEQVLDRARLEISPQSVHRLTCMQKSTQITWTKLKQSNRWQAAQTMLQTF